MNKNHAFARIVNTDYYDGSYWIDDDELEEIHELLWRGYAPKHDRHDFEVSCFGGPVKRVPHRSEKQRQEALWQAEETKRWWQRQRALDVERRWVDENRRRYPPGSTCFICDGCQGRFTCTVPEDSIEREYLETFGPGAPMNQRQVFCESCFAVAMNAGGRT